MTIPLYSVKVLQYTTYEKQNSKEIGNKIDITIKKHFSGKHVAIRALGSQEHSCSVDALIKIIKKLGHDHYDPARRGEKYENVDGKKIDFFALDFKIKKWFKIKNF